MGLILRFSTLQRPGLQQSNPLWKYQYYDLFDLVIVSERPEVVSGFAYTIYESLLKSDASSVYIL
jgi:hypothetical protein